MFTGVKTRKLQRAFDGFCSGRAPKRFSQVAGSDFRKSSGCVSRSGIEHPLRMQSKSIHLRFDCRDNLRMSMAQCENPEPTKTVNEFMAHDIAQNTTFTDPFNGGALNNSR